MVSFVLCKIAFLTNSIRCWIIGVYPTPSNIIAITASLEKQSQVSKFFPLFDVSEADFAEFPAPLSELCHALRD